MKREKFIMLCALSGAPIKAGSYYIVDNLLHIQKIPQPQNFLGGWAAVWKFVKSKGGILYRLTEDAKSVVKVRRPALYAPTAPNQLPSVSEKNRWRELSTLSAREVNTHESGRKYTAFDEGTTDRPSRRRAKNNIPIMIR